MKKIKGRKLLDKVRDYLEAPEAVVITGMRRTGKTTLLNLIYGEIDSRNKIFLDLENPVNRKYFEEENYEKIKNNLEFLGANFGSRPFVFLDEIQLAKNLPSVAKYFIDHYGMKFFLTGSASFYLKNRFAETLAGRKCIFELFPLTFEEFLDFKESTLGVPRPPGEVTRAVFETLAPLYDEYILMGGFPEVVLKKSVEEKRRALDEIFTSYFQGQVMQLGDFRKNDVLRDLIFLLAQRTGSKLEVSKVAVELGVSRPTVMQYISFLEQTYFIKTVRPFAGGRDSEIRRAPKTYICDSGLANHLARIEAGRLFENSVFQNLRLKGEVNYYQRKGGAEIDFVLDRRTAFEVKVSPREGDVKKLENLSGQIGLEDCYIVSKNHSDLRKVMFGFTL